MMKKTVGGVSIETDSSYKRFDSMLYDKMDGKRSHVPI